MNDTHKPVLTTVIFFLCLYRVKKVIDLLNKKKRPPATEDRFFQLIYSLQGVRPDIIKSAECQLRPSALRRQIF